MDHVSNRLHQGLKCSDPPAQWPGSQMMGPIHLQGRYNSRCRHKITTRKTYCTNPDSHQDKLLKGDDVNHFDAWLYGLPRGTKHYWTKPLPSTLKRIAATAKPDEKKWRWKKDYLESQPILFQWKRILGRFHSVNRNFGKETILDTFPRSTEQIRICLSSSKLHRSKTLWWQPKSYRSINALTLPRLHPRRDHGPRTGRIASRKHELPSQDLANTKNKATYPLYNLPVGIKEVHLNLVQSIRATSISQGRFQERKCCAQCTFKDTQTGDATIRLPIETEDIYRLEHRKFI